MSDQGAITLSIEPGRGFGWCVVGSDGGVYYYALSYETAEAKLPHLEALLATPRRNDN
jgi:hypothetical protein